MKATITKDFIDLISDEGYELYNEELEIVTSRITAPLDLDLTKWIERKIEIIE